MLNSKFLIIITLSLLLGGCSLNKSDKSIQQITPGENASFFVGALDASIIQTHNHKTFSIPVKKTVSLKACLLDAQYSKPISHHAFQVITEDKKIDVISDTSGCVTWHEGFDYNSLADAEDLTLRRTILSQKIHKGQRSIEWIFNPWENNIESALKIKKPDLNIATAADLKARLGKGNKTPLIVSDLKASIERDVSAAGIRLRLQVQIDPKLLVKTTSGNQTAIALTQGQFKAELYLINIYNENGQPHFVLKAQSPQIIIENLQNGIAYLRAQLPFNDFRNPGLAALGLRLQPIDAPPGVQDYEGVFALGDIENIVGNFFGRFRSDIKLSDLKTEEKTESTINPPIQQARLVVQPFEFIPSGWRTHSTNNRQRLFNVRTHIIHGLDRKPLVGHSFTVTKTNGQKEVKLTDYDGSLTWADTMDVSFTEAECFQEKTIKIEHKELGLAEVRKVKINPWNNFSDLGYDLKYNSPSTECSPESDRRTRIVAHQFGISIDSKYEYDILPTLEMVLVKKAILTLSGVEFAKGSLNSPNGVLTSPLPSGKYRVKYAIINSNVHNFSETESLAQQLFFSDQVTLNYRAGDNFSLPIDLKIYDPKMIGLTTRLLLQIEPEHASENLTEAVFTAPIILAQRDQSRDLRPLINIAPGYLDTAVKVFAQNLQKLTAPVAPEIRKQAFAKENYFQLINLKSDSRLLPFAKSDLEQWLLTAKMPELLSWQICQHWVKDRLHPLGLINTWNQQQNILSYRCAALTKINQHSFFDIQFHYLPKNPRVEGQDGIQTTRKNLMLNQTYQMQKSYAANTMYSMSFDISSGGAIKDLFTNNPILRFVSATSGWRFQVSKSRIWSDTVSTAAASMDSIQMSRNATYIPIRMDSYEKCVSIRLNPLVLKNPQNQGFLNLKMDIAGQIDKILSGYFICSGEQTPISRPMVESYYTLNQVHTADELISDPYADNGRPYFASMRGAQDFVRFLSFIHQDLHMPADVKSEIINQSLSQDFNSELFLRGVPNFPGHLIRDR